MVIYKNKCSDKYVSEVQRAYIFFKNTKNILKHSVGVLRKGFSAMGKAIYGLRQGFSGLRECKYVGSLFIFLLRKGNSGLRYTFSVLRKGK